MKNRRARDGKPYRNGSIVTFLYSYMELGDKQLVQGEVDYSSTGGRDGDVPILIRRDGKLYSYQVHPKNVVERIKW